MGPWANPALVSLWLLYLCSVASAGLHRLSSFQLISPKASPGLPKRLSVLRVNNLVLAAYDSDTGRLAPRNGYSPGDQEFWSEITTWYEDWDSWVETEYQVLVREINSSAPQAEPYYMQVLQTCDMHDATGAVRVIARYALNGEDVLRYQSDQNRWFAVHPAAQPVAERWNEKGASFDVMNIHTRWQYLTFIGLTAPFTAQQTAQPTVRVALVPGTQVRPCRLVCHVTGFYPRDIEVTWERGGQVALGEQQTSGIRPNADSTFQIQVSIKLGHEGCSPTEHVCVVRHSSLGSTLLRMTRDSQAMGWAVTMAIVVVCLLAVLGVGALVWYLRRKPGEAEPHSRPYMAYLEIKHGKKTSNCDGFLVAENFVLTAAHCKAGEITVTLGAHDISKWRWSQQKIRVCRKIPHPEFDKKTRKNDIMLLELSKGAKQNSWVRPITLPRPDERVKPGTVCSVTGWGRRKREFTNRLKEVDVKVLEDKTCRSNPDWPYCHYDPSTMLCAGDPETGQDPVPCDFDGGPLVCGETAEGIVSFRSRNEANPTVYTRVAAFIPWIEAMMKSGKSRDSPGNSAQNVSVPLLSLDEAQL